MLNDDTPPLLVKRSASSINDAFPMTSYRCIKSRTQASEVTEYIVRSLSRLVLHMLWHQCLGHLNFRRLSTMHHFVKGMPEFTLPNELEACPVCLAAKLRKPPAGTATTMRSTV